MVNEKTKMQKVRKIIFFGCLLLLATGRMAHAQTEYFRVADGLPCMPVLAGSSTISTPATGAFFFSTDDSQPYIYTGSSWESLCSTTIPLLSSEAAWFRVENGIPLLPLHDADTITGTAVAGTAFYSAGGGIIVSDGSNWKSMYAYATTDNVTVNNNMQMGNIDGHRGMIIIPVLDSEPSVVEAGAFYFDSASSDFRVFDGFSWQDIDCSACPPQVTAVRIRGSSSEGFSAGGYAYYDKDDRTESTSADYRWFISAEEGGENIVEELEKDSAYVYTFQTEHNGLYLNLGIKVHTDEGTLKISDESIGSVLIFNCEPQITALSLSYLSVQTFSADLTLEGSYAYYDKEDDPEGASIVSWYKADNEQGDNEISLGSGSIVYSYEDSDNGKYLRCEVTPVAQVGNSTGATASSDYYRIYNCPPQADALIIAGAEEAGTSLLLSSASLSAGYAYYDKEDDAEGTSVINWYLSDDVNGTNKQYLGTGDTYAYTYSSGYDGKFIGLGITPIAATGYSTGEETLGGFRQIVSP